MWKELNCCTIYAYNLYIMQFPLHLYYTHALLYSYLLVENIFPHLCIRLIIESKFPNIFLYWYTLFFYKNKTNVGAKYFYRNIIIKIKNTQPLLNLVLTKIQYINAHIFLTFLSFWFPGWKLKNRKIYKEVEKIRPKRSKNVNFGQKWPNFGQF